MKKALSCLSIAAFATAAIVSVPTAHATANPTTSASPVAAMPPAPQAYGQEPWENPPSEWKEVERRGFHDGIQGARKDAENHRPPNVNNRDEYRHPSVPHRDRRAYREGFRRGYQVGVEHLMHYYHRHR